MLVTIISTVLTAATAASLAFTIFFINDYFFNSGTRSPNGFDYLLLLGLVVLPIVGACLGFVLGQELHSEQKSALVFITKIYVVIPLLLIIFLATCFYLSALMTKRDVAPTPQNETLVSQLGSSSWKRSAQSPDSERVTTKQDQMLQITFNSNNTCPEGRAYSALYQSGLNEEGCWSIQNGSNTLDLTNSKFTAVYQDTKIDGDTLSFRSAGQLWIFSKEN